MPKLYTCEQVAEMFTVKKITVWDWIRTGKLEALKIGKSYRITQEQLDIFISKAST